MRGRFPLLLGLNALTVTVVLECKQVANGVWPVIVEEREVDKWDRGSSPSYECAIEHAHQPEVVLKGVGAHRRFWRQFAL